MSSSKSIPKKPKNLTKKEDDVGKWFKEILEFADIVDYSYPVKGCGAWKEYGWSLRNNIVDVLRKLLTETQHGETYFPFLIPEKEFKKEAEFVKGFEDEVYWVTHGGMDELSEKLAIRPTSEIPIYCMFAKWIRTHADLPLKIWQVVSVFRYETKETSPLLRDREVQTFLEAHTAHATPDEAVKQVKEAVEIYKKFFDTLSLPYIISIRPKFDTFPGADYSIPFDILFPDGLTVQIGTVHNLQKFAEAFDIKYTDKEGKDHFVSQTCYGISERAIRSVIENHGDDHGMILPPIIAPIQIIIIPIVYKDSMEKEVNYTKEVYELLKEQFRIKLDDGPERPGYKYNKWEIKGVPLRIEIGKKEADERTVTIVRRDNFQRTKVEIDNCIPKIKDLMKEIADNLTKKAWDFQNSHAHKVKSFFSFEEKDAIDTLLDEDGNFKGGIVEVPVCGDTQCEEGISKYIGILGKSFEDVENVEGTCICGRPATTLIRVAKMH